MKFYTGVTKTLGFRLFLALLIISVLIFATMTYLLLQSSKAQLMHQVETKAEWTNLLIKKSIYRSMLFNRTEDVDALIEILGKEAELESIRIYGKDGEVSYSSDLADIGEAFELKDAQCTVCHVGEIAKGNVAFSSPPRISDSGKGYRVLAMSVAIPNEDVCAKPECHSPPSEQSVIGILDTKISLEQIDEDISHSRNLMIFYSVIAVILIELAAVFFIWRMVQSRIKLVVDGSEQVINGNLEHRIEVRGDDEIGTLASSLNEMTGKLVNELKRSRAIVSSIDDAVRVLAPMAKELVAIAEQQASGSIQQASASEEAVTSSEEIAAVSRQIAENAAEVSNSAEEALSLTKSGEEKLNLTQVKFGDINEKMRSFADAVLNLGKQSQEIGDIVEIIDEISEQTNLLALNASIEAVGAGEHGKRFGVVAQEIRRLANSTAQATGNIQDIINRMQKSLSSSIMLAEEGEKSVSASRNVLEELAGLFSSIFGANTNSFPRLKEIDLMTTQQSTASSQMANTISEIRETAQQSSSSAEELQVSIRELEEIVSQLESHLEEDPTKKSS